MSPFDIVLIVLVIAVVALGARRAIGTARGTRDCCSGAVKNPGRMSADAASASVSDIDPSHYPYEAALEVGGMTCEHCVSNVTNALDGVEGTWATVELAGGQARVRSKSPINGDLLRAALEAAGYRLVSLR